MMTTMMARRAGAPWLIRNTQNRFRAVLTVHSSGGECTVATQHFIQPDQEYLIPVRGFYGAGARWEKKGGGGCAGRKLILARDALPLSITDVGNACELTTATAETAPSKTGNHGIGPSRGPLRGSR